MPLPSPKNRSAYGSYLYFDEPGVLETFMRDYRRILKENFQNVRIEGGGEYWSCAQEHDPRNWNWKPWQHLSGCVESGVLMILPQGTSLLSAREGNWNASARF